MRKFLLGSLIALVLGGAVLVAVRGLPLRVTVLKAGELPAGVQIAGELVQAVSWHDKTGDNLAILTQTVAQWDDDDRRTQRIKAIQLRKVGESWKTVWAVNDAVEACPLDVVCAFVKDTLEVTDINHDGVAEVNFVYRLGCFGGLDPWEQKLLLVEDGRKFALRGTTSLKIEEGRYEGGAMKPDPAFKKAPVGFEDYARTKWKRYVDHGLPVY